MKMVMAGNESKGSWIAPVSNAGAGIFSTIFGGRERRKAWQRSVAHEQKVWERDTAYNHPAAQMERFREAGLNPNLMYGQGQPGLAQGSPMRSEAFMELDPMLAMQMRLSSAQVGKLDAETDFIRSKTESETYRQDLMQVQADVLRANPYLNAQYMDRLVKAFVADADVRISKGEFLMQEHKGPVAEGASHLWVQMHKELDILEQRFQLGSKDLEIRAKIFESKEFENALKEIQVKFMRDGDFTPQHAVEFLKLLFMKLGK